MCFELPILPLVLRILCTFNCVLNTHTSPGIAYSLHFHLCFELPILPLVLHLLYTFTCVSNYPYLMLRILCTFNCVLNYPYFPWSCVFSTLSHVFWITPNTPGLNLYPYFPWCCVFSTLHMCSELPIHPLVLRILYTFICVLSCP